MPPLGQPQKYAQAWETGLYNGFSERTSARDSTPLLERLIAGLTSDLKKLGSRKLNENETPALILEAGAGLGSHALRLVQEGFSVIANEYSELAAREIHHKRDQLTPSAQARLQIAKGDILDCLRSLAEESIAGFYAHSLVHTFSEDERKLLYTEIRRVQPQGGIIAVSFKAYGDYVQNEKGNGVKPTEAGPVISDHAGRISRLFVTDPFPLIRELQDADYQVFDTYWWDVPKNSSQNARDHPRSQTEGMTRPFGARVARNIKAEHFDLGVHHQSQTDGNDFIKNRIEYRKFVGLIAQKTNGEKR